MIFWLAFLGFAVLWWTAMVMGPQVDDLRIAAWHHAHIGAALALLGLALDSVIVAWLGVLILGDDAVQHGIQRWYLPGWRSPLHRLYLLAARRLPLLERIGTWLDRRFQ